MTREDTRQEEPPVDWPLVALAWVLPGAGHLVQGRRLRAAVFAAVVLAAFLTGIALDGELAVPRHGDPFSYLRTFACLGNGILYLAGRLLGFGHGDPTAAGWTFGNAFLYTAGLMNWLVVLDASDIARGRKA